MMMVELIDNFGTPFRGYQTHLKRLPIWCRISQEIMNEIVINIELKHYNMFRLRCQFLTIVNKTIRINQIEGGLCAKPIMEQSPTERSLHDGSKVPGFGLLDFIKLLHHQNFELILT